MTELGGEDRTEIRRRRLCQAGSVSLLGSFAGCMRPLLEGDEANGEVENNTANDGELDGEAEGKTANDAEIDGEAEDETTELNLVWEGHWARVIGVGEQFFVSEHSGKRVHRLNDDGDPVWTSEEVAEEYEMFPEFGRRQRWITAAADVIAAGASNGNVARLYAFDEESGDRRWLHETNPSRSEQALRALAGDNRRLYYGVNSNRDDTDQKATVRAVDIETGDAVWETQLESDYFTGLAVEGSRLYVGFTQSLHVLDAATGEQLNDRAFTVGFNNFNAANGSLYVGRDNLRAYDLSTDELEWEAELNRGSYAVSTYGDGTVYGGTDSGWVTARDIEEGSQLWELRVNDSVRSPMVVTNGLLSFQDINHLVYVVDTDDGKLVRQIDDTGIGIPHLAATDEKMYIEGKVFESKYATPDT